MSGLTCEGDEMKTLTILKTLGWHITNFKTLVAKLKMGDNFGGELYLTLINILYN